MVAQLNRIEPSTSAQDFFKNYISKRTPVVIKGFPDDATFKAQRWADLDYLESKAGDVSLLVEPMHPATQQFGSDVQRIPMPFRDFLVSLRSEGGPFHYLTTQYSGEDWDALTVFSPPTDALADDFPLIPRIMGNLFLQQVNLWLGKSVDGSSSGLHHDFHDNLYILLKGCKRFVLYPPEEHQNLYPYGDVHEVYQNGVIAYDPVLRADGLDQRVALKARMEALEQQMNAQQRGKGKGRMNGEADRLQQAYDEAHCELMKYEDEDSEVMNGNQWAGEEEDFEVDGEEGEEDGDFGSLAGDLEDGRDDYDLLMGNLDEVDDAFRAAASGDEGSSGEDADDVEKPSDKEPASFSRLPTAHLHKHLKLPTTAVLPIDFSPELFPRFGNSRAPFVVELSAGETLYLPASWWHEVTSSGSAIGDEKSENGTNMHMAFNYWFYPPDAESFDEPYKDKLVWDCLKAKAGKECQKVNLENIDRESVLEGKRKRDVVETGATKRAKR
ncbi:uncharacterized protein FIBRA_02575 [Fibroporia radiculosa]|uniref:JmjC domain-containing protein n=1 Tax=Fibroporia radiculosa TaxID=599839 RepID=J4I949_9APHY|nr:uncharacterized protein FIBRA_02575 [Fibroporia radiculosa]CCM00541.1 predicted protein [Fibroporia radiculosa]